MLAFLIATGAWFGITATMPFAGDIGTNYILIHATVGGVVAGLGIGVYCTVDSKDGEGR